MYLRIFTRKLFYFCLLHNIIAQYFWETDAKGITQDSTGCTEWFYQFIVTVYCC